MNTKITERIALIVLVIIGFCLASEAAQRTWTGGGADNNWSNTNNWSSGLVPGSADDAIFDGTSGKDATVNSAFGGTVNNLILASGYTGTITLNRALTVNMAYAQTNGTVDASSTNMTVGLASSSGKGHFTLAGGTFICPTNTLTINGYINTFAKTGGTFNPTNGTVVFKGWNTTFNAPNTVFYGLTVNMNNDADVNSALIIAAGTTNVVLGALVHNSGFIKQSAASATLEARSNMVVGASAKGGNATIAFLVDGDQAISCTSTGVTCGLYINKPSGSVSALGGDLVIGRGASGQSGNFTLVAGTFNSSSNSFIHNGYQNSWTRLGGTFNHNNGTMVFRGWQSTLNASNVVFNGLTVDMPYGGSGDGDWLAITAGTNIVLGSLLHNSGSIGVSLGGASATLEARSNLVIGAAAIGGCATIAFLVAGDQAISCLSNGATCGLYINKPSGAVSATGGDLGIGRGIANESGNFTLAGGTFNSTSNSFVFWPNARNWIQSGGTFNPNNGTVVFRGFAMGFYGTNTAFNKMTVNLDSNGSGFNFAMPASLTNVVASTYVHSNGFVNTGTLLVQGNVIVTTNSPGGSAAFIYGGTNNQSYTNAGGGNLTGAITVNKTTNSVILLSPMAYTNVNQDVTITAGTLDLAGQPLAVKRTLTVGAQGALKFNGTEQATATNVTISAGATVGFRIP